MDTKDTTVLVIDDPMTNNNAIDADSRKKMQKVVNHMSAILEKRGLQDTVKILPSMRVKL